MAETKKYLDYAGLKVYHKNIGKEMQKQAANNYTNALEMVWGPIIKQMYENYISSNDWMPFTDYVAENQEEINNTLNLFNNYDYSSLNDAIYASNSFLLTTIANFTNGMLEEMGEQYAKSSGAADVDLSNYIAKDTTVTDLDGNEVNAIDAIQMAYEKSIDLDLKFYGFDDTGDDPTPLVAKKIALWNFYNDNKDKDYALKSEVVDLDTLKQVVAEAPHIKKEKVETLPPEADGVENVLYLVPRSNTEDGNYYDQYLLIDGKWDPIGSTKTNLANYYTKDEAQAAIDEAVAGVDIASISNDDIDLLFKSLPEGYAPYPANGLYPSDGELGVIWAGNEVIRNEVQDWEVMLDGHLSGQGITRIEIPTTSTQIGQITLANNLLEIAVIPDTIEYVANKALAGNPIKKVYINKNTKFETDSFPDTAEIIYRD